MKKLKSRAARKTSRRLFSENRTVSEKREVRMEMREREREKERDGEGLGWGRKRETMRIYKKRENTKY